MAITLVNHGVHEVSGTALGVAVGNIGALTGQTISGTGLHFVYTGEGQINLLEVQTS